MIPKPLELHNLILFTRYDYSLFVISLKILLKISLKTDFFTGFYTGYSSCALCALQYLKHILNIKFYILNKVTNKLELKKKERDIIYIQNTY